MTDLESQVKRAIHTYRFSVGVTWVFRVLFVVMILAFVIGSFSHGWLPWTLVGIALSLLALWVHRDDINDARGSLLFALQMIALDRRVEARGLALDQLEARIEAVKEKLK